MEKVKFVYSTGFKVVSFHWNDKEQRVKNVLTATDSQTINNYLHTLSIEINKLTPELTAKRERLTPQYHKHLPIKKAIL